MPNGLRVIFAGGALISLYLIALALLLLGSWLRARRAGLPVTFWKLIGMRMRKTNAAKIVAYAIEAKEADIDITTDTPGAIEVGLVSIVDHIEAHDLAGGDLRHVIDAMIHAKEFNVDLPWDRACAIDLSARDVVRLVKDARETDKDVTTLLFGDPNGAEHYKR